MYTIEYYTTIEKVKYFYLQNIDGSRVSYALWNKSDGKWQKPYGFMHKW